MESCSARKADGSVQDSKELCAECGEKISEDHILCGAKVYHPLCMKCQVCGEVLRGKYLTYEDRPICEKDFRVSCLLSYPVKQGDVSGSGSHLHRV